MMNHPKRAAADAFIKIKFKLKAGNCTTRSLSKNPNPTFSLCSPRLASLIHSDSSLNVVPPLPESVPPTLNLALVQFDKLTKQQPFPACGINHFNKILQSITKLKHYTNSLDTSKQLCSIGVPPPPQSAPQTLEEALDQFDELTKQQSLPDSAIDQFNQILDCLAKLQRYHISLDLFKQLCSLVVNLDNDTINTVIKCCCQLYRTNEAFSVLGWNLKRACTSIPDRPTFSILLDGLILEDRIFEAHEFFTKLIHHKLCKPDILLYNKIIGGLCSFRIHDVRLPNLSGPSILLLNPPDYAKRDNDLRLGKTMVRSAGDIFAEMVYQQGISPDVVTHNSFLSGLCKLHYWREASLELKEMLDSNISPNLQTCNILVTALCNEGKIDAANFVLYFMDKSNISPDIVTYNSFIEAHCFLGNIPGAMTFFDIMVSSDVVPDISTYNCLLNGCCKFDKMDDAMLLYRAMNRKGLKPNYLTSITMLRSLLRADRFGDARMIFDEVSAQRHMMLDPSTYHDILMILCFKHRLDLALSLFRLVGDSVLNADISVYNELIDGAIRCKKFDIAWDLFNELSDKDVKPDNHTYIELIRAFSTEGILDKAKKLFSEMEMSGDKPDSHTFNDILEGHLLKKRYDDDHVEMLLHKMNERGFHLNDKPSMLLHELIAAGSLDTTTIKLIHNNNTFNDILEGHLLEKQYDNDDVEMLLHKMSERGFHLKNTTLTLLHQLIAAGSIDTTMERLISKLEPTVC